MGKMMHVGTDVDEGMMIDIDHLAKSTGRSHDALVHYALKCLIQETAEMRAFIQEGIDSAENEPLIPHEQMVAEMNAMIAEHRSRCVS